MKIRMIKSDFFRIHNKINTKNVEIEQDYASFELDYSELKKIKKQKIPYEILESKSAKLKLFFKTYYLAITGIILLFSIIYINKYRVDEIYFTEETPINSEIESRIDSSLVSLFWFKFSNLDYNLLSSQLGHDYIEYSYISVEQKNNKIKVEIVSNDNNKRIETPLGNIYASCDGIVSTSYASNGKLLVSKNQYIHKGDLLIKDTGNGARGYVCATNYKRIVETIPKEQSEINYGNKINYTSFDFLGNSFTFNKNKFSNYDSSENIVFNLFSIFQVKKIEEIEKNVIIKTYDIESARKKAISNIYQNFEDNKILNSEKIDDIYERSIEETDSAFRIIYIVKMTSSIGIFSKEDIIWDLKQKLKI